MASDFRRRLPTVFARHARTVYQSFGFSKGYNFALFFIFAGAFAGFCLARLEFLNFSGVFCPIHGPTGAVPGECYFYQQGYGKFGIILHLGAILPAGLLAVLQFIPIVRHRYPVFHRINGYIVLFLSLVGVIGALMITRHAFGGGVDTQTGIGLLIVMFITSLALAYYNIERLKIEQHRSWMLRAWFHAGSIVTMRLISVIIAVIISGQGYFSVRSCAQLNSIFNSQSHLLEAFPDCTEFCSGEDVNKNVIVPADMNGNDATGASAIGVSFGAALWLSLAIHAIGIEIYLHLTSAESERLRKISYQRQVRAGMKNPGRAGLTADRLGDCTKWTPTTD